MSAEQDVEYSVTEETGLTINSPEVMREARVLGKRATINIIQILFSKIRNKSRVSWWTLGALRQKTHYNTVRLKEILKNLTLIGLLEDVEVNNLINYSLTKKPFHGIVPLKEAKSRRRRYVGAQHCYRINAPYVDLILNSEGNRVINVPAENMHLENLKLLKCILKKRSMLVLQTLGKAKEPLDTKYIQNCLNEYFDRRSLDNQIDYNLTDIRKLAKQPFIDNIGAKLSTNQVKYNGRWTIVNRDTLLNQKNTRSVFYSLNYDKIRINFTNKIGQDFIKNNNSFEIHFPNTSEILDTKKNLVDDLVKHGIVVDLL